MLRLNRGSQISTALAATRAILRSDSSEKVDRSAAVTRWLGEDRGTALSKHAIAYRMDVTGVPLLLLAVVDQMPCCASA
jgi:hypothetical protein